MLHIGSESINIAMNIAKEMDPSEVDPPAEDVLGLSTGLEIGAATGLKVGSKVSSTTLMFNVKPLSVVSSSE
jgi:hypothetical protein